MQPLTRLRCLLSALPLSLCLGLCACGPGAVALHSLAEAPEDFYDLPFPSDLRLRPDGSLDLSRYPRLPGQLTRYVQDMDGQVSGAGPSAAILFRLSAPLDPGSLPASAAQSQKPGASAFVVDLTETSPTYGRTECHPPRLTHQAARGSSSASGACPACSPPPPMAVLAYGSFRSARQASRGRLLAARAPQAPPCTA